MSVRPKNKCFFHKAMLIKPFFGVLCLLMVIHGIILGSTQVVYQKKCPTASTTSSGNAGASGPSVTCEECTPTGDTYKTCETAATVNPKIVGPSPSIICVGTSATFSADYSNNQKGKYKEWQPYDHGCEPDYVGEGDVTTSHTETWTPTGIDQGLTLSAGTHQVSLSVSATSSPEDSCYTITQPQSATLTVVEVTSLKYNGSAVCIGGTAPTDSDFTVTTNPSGHESLFTPLTIPGTESAGTKTVTTGACGTSSNTTTYDVVEVAKIVGTVKEDSSGKLYESTLASASLTNTETIYIASGCTINFWAVSNPTKDPVAPATVGANIWPTNEPTWGGVASGTTGETYSKTFSSVSDSGNIEVKCGPNDTVKALQVIVVEVESIGGNLIAPSTGKFVLSDKIETDIGTNQTVYAGNGMTYSFFAVSNPKDAPVAPAKVGDNVFDELGDKNGDGKNDQPIWEGVASGNTGDSVIVTFNVPSTSATDYKYVKARCGSGDDWKVIRVIVFEIDFAPDYNHDRAIDSSDIASSVAGNTHYFWLNDDYDDGDSAINKSDAPHVASNKNCDDLVVNGTRDLIDFAPLLISIPIFDRTYPGSSSGFTFFLKTDGGAINVINEDLAIDPNYPCKHHEDYTTSSTIKKKKVATVYSSEELELNANLAKKILQGDKTVILFEGSTKMVSNSLFLVMKHGKEVILEKKLTMDLDSVDEMFRYKNLIGESKESGDTGPSDRLGTPGNLPDESSDYLIFIYGYNVDANEGEGWTAEIFKRFYWAGSKSRFVGVAWYGCEGDVPTTRSSPDYHSNVKNAFETSSAFATFVNSLSGNKVVVAHSLGNMVVSSAIQDHSASVNSFFLVNAAVSLEAYDKNIEENDWMVHPFWKKPWLNKQIGKKYKGGAYNKKLQASEWNKLFLDDPNDFRGNLTWRGRFSDVPTLTSVYNFYSGGDQRGEECLRNWQQWPNNNGEYVPNPYKLDGLFQCAWAIQEILKGDMPNGAGGFGGSDVMGWGFNFSNNGSGYYKPSKRGNLQWLPEDKQDPSYSANDIPNEELKTKPFFRNWHNTTLYEPGLTGSNYASQNYNEILARGIPAVSYATGANRCTVLGTANNINMPNLPNTGWPMKEQGGNRKVNNWLHNDMREVPYSCCIELFKKIVNLGGI